MLLASLKVLLIVVLVLVNGVFAMAEFALLKARRKSLGEGKSAQAVLHLLEEPNRFLSTVQVAITAVGTLAGALGGATLADELGVLLNRFEPLAPHGEALAVVVVWLSITFLSLVLGELVPKRLALRSPEVWALRLGRLMRALSVLFTPLVKLLSVSTNLILRLLGQEPQRPREVVTEAEVREMIAQAADQGQLKPLEHELAESVFLLDDRKVEDMMTPRDEIHSLRVDDNQESVLRTLEQGLHSRYLLMGEEPDEALGVVLTRDILRTFLAEGELELDKLCREAPVISSELDMLGALDVFKKTPTSLVLVNDQGKRLVGLLTAQDLLEAFAGRIHKPGDIGLT